MLLCGASYLSQSLPIRGRKICLTYTQGFLVTQTQQFHLHTLVELRFSSFSPAKFTDHYFAYYLALEKNKGALETEDEPFTAFCAYCSPAPLFLCSSVPTAYFSSVPLLLSAYPFFVPLFPFAYCSLVTTAPLFLCATRSLFLCAL